MIEHFLKNIWQLKSDNYFPKKALSKMFHWVPLRIKWLKKISYIYVFAVRWQKYTEQINPAFLNWFVVSRMMNLSKPMLKNNKIEAAGR